MVKEAKTNRSHQRRHTARAFNKKSTDCYNITTPKNTAPTPINTEQISTNNNVIQSASRSYGVDNANNTVSQTSNRAQPTTLEFKINSRSKLITNLHYAPAYAQLHGNDNFTTVQTHGWAGGISSNGDAPTNRYAQLQEKRQF